jgi:hypothetical protein
MPARQMLVEEKIQELLALYPQGDEMLKMVLVKLIIKSP